MLTNQEDLLKQLINARSYGMLVGRANFVAAARLVVDDQAEVWRDIHGMLRLRRRPPDRDIVEQRVPVAGPDPATDRRLPRA